MQRNEWLLKIRQRAENGLYLAMERCDNAAAGFYLNIIEASFCPNAKATAIKAVE